jgi:hypothetical protein
MIADAANAISSSTQTDQTAGKAKSMAMLLFRYGTVPFFVRSAVM